VLVGCVVALLVATVGGLVVLWPDDRDLGPSTALGGPTLAATVVAVRDVECPGPARQDCRQIDVRVEDGARPATATLDIGPTQFVERVDVGDDVRVQRAETPPGAQVASPYAYAGLDRRGTLVWLVVALAVVIVVLARWRGVLALLGFALSLGLLTQFLVPAMLAGTPPMLVALVGAFAVMFITVGLTYGVSAASAAAILGIAVSLVFAAVLGTLAARSAGLDGRTGDLAVFLQQTDPDLSLQGIIIAGLLLAALGVVADMAVTQASAVMALRRANPALGARGLFREGFAVGRDHLIATTHTLVLVYAGATLPLLLVLQGAGVRTTDALNAQDLAEPLVATLVGSLALMLSVPLTTALAAAFVSRVPAGALPAADGHGHHHH
jgi:uncharacterized membrane protein